RGPRPDGRGARSARDGRYRARTADERRDRLRGGALLRAIAHDPADADARDRDAEVLRTAVRFRRFVECDRAFVRNRRDALVVRHCSNGPEGAKLGPRPPGGAPVLLEGKKALIFGVANDMSNAWGIAQAFHNEGATV